MGAAGRAVSGRGEMAVCVAPTVVKLPVAWPTTARWEAQKSSVSQSDAIVGLLGYMAEPELGSP